MNPITIKDARSQIKVHFLLLARAAYSVVIGWLLLHCFADDALVIVLFVLKLCK